MRFIGKRQSTHTANNPRPTTAPNGLLRLFHRKKHGQEMPNKDEGKARKALRKTMKALMVTAAITGTALAGTYAGLKCWGWQLDSEVSRLEHQDDGLAILISYGTHSWWDEALKPVGQHFIPEYVARVETAFGQKADVVIKGATSQDIYDTLRNDKIQNLVLFGHGTWTSWLATDKNVPSFFLSYKIRERRRGYLVRHTCGIEKTYEGKSFSRKKVLANLRADAIRLNKTLERSSLSDDYHMMVLFVPSRNAVDDIGDHADGYDVQFTVMKGSRDYVGFGHLFRGSEADPRIAEGNADSSMLETISFQFTKDGFGEIHPLKVGRLYSKAELDMIADYLNRMHSEVSENMTHVKRARATFGTGVFDDDKIIVVEGINYPWQWMFEPFGPRTELDHY